MQGKSATHRMKPEHRWARSPSARVHVHIWRLVLSRTGSLYAIKWHEPDHSTNPEVAFRIMFDWEVRWTKCDHTLGKSQIRLVHRELPQGRPPENYSNTTIITTAALQKYLTKRIQQSWAKPMLRIDSKAMMPTTSSSKFAQSAGSSASESKKRSRDDCEDSNNLSPEALAKMSRSERKRHREKKRRNDVNKGFDELMELLIEIDPVVRAEHQDRARRGIAGTADDHALSRVELINRTVEVLHRVHKENEERKLIIQQLLEKPASPPTMLDSLLASKVGHTYLFFLCPCKASSKQPFLFSFFNRLGSLTRTRLPSATPASNSLDWWAYERTLQWL